MLALNFVPKFSRKRSLASTSLLFALLTSSANVSAAPTPAVAQAWLVANIPVLSHWTDSQGWTYHQEISFSSACVGTITHYGTSLSGSTYNLGVTFDLGDAVNSYGFVQNDRRLAATSPQFVFRAAAPFVGQSGSDAGVFSVGFRDDTIVMRRSIPGLDANGNPDQVAVDPMNSLWVVTDDMAVADLRARDPNGPTDSDVFAQDRQTHNVLEIWSPDEKTALRFARAFDVLRRACASSTGGASPF